MLSPNPKKKKNPRGQEVSPILLLFSVAFIYFQPLSANTAVLFSKPYWQLQQHLTVPEHSSVRRSGCHITALGMVSAGRARNPSRSTIPAGFVSPADTSGLDPRPPLLGPERRDQERDPKCLWSWGGWRRRGGGAGCDSSRIWERCSSYLHTCGFQSRTQQE